LASGPGLSRLIHFVGNRHPVDKLRVTKITTEEVKLVMMTVQDVRKKLGIGQATAYRLVYRGDIPAYKVGRVLRIDPRDVDSYLARNRK
jgi:excisionase family DNA binding protein